VGDEAPRSVPDVARLVDTLRVDQVSALQYPRREIRGADTARACTELDSAIADKGMWSPSCLGFRCVKRSRSNGPAARPRSSGTLFDFLLACTALPCPLPRTVVGPAAYQRVATAAAVITFATTPGAATIERCPALTLVMWA
jgi:hypothetical protein